MRGLTIDGANYGTVGILFVSGKSLTIQKSFAILPIPESALRLAQADVIRV
jgi:hypothetical protein